MLAILRFQARPARCGIDMAPDILECTLRDGSYAIDFQFSREDTFTIARRLDDLGFPYIEVGHGIGLGASRRNMGVAAATDDEYMAAAAEAVHKGKWGMFCIPGIAELSDIDAAAMAGMGFVRVGTEVSDVEKGRPFIERARANGIFVFANLMKSYVCAPDEFAAQARKCADYGAQCVYVVDSAGGMLPEEIGAYADALRVAAPGVKLGFHGHNNLGLGVANALYCARAGFDVIDTSLQGFGRSSGNTPTEQFVAVLIRAGFATGYDPVAVMEAGEELIRPLIQEIGHNSLDTTAGLAQFHSSYMRRVLDAAKARRVDPRRLILALCEHDRTGAPPELIDAAATEVATQQRRRGLLFAKTFLGKSYYGEEQR